MSETLRVPLLNAAQASSALMAVYKQLKPWLIAGHRYTVTVSPQTRSDAQNRILHSCLSDVARQVEWAGAKRDADTWKRLMTAAWMRESQQVADILPALDGRGVDVLYRHTSKLSVKECAELVTWIHAWGTAQGVQWSRTSLGRDVPDEVLKETA